MRGVTITHYCAICEDQGWDSVWCGIPGPTKKPWQDLAGCERSAPHQAHEFVRICTCSQTNPAILKRKDAQAQYAASREPKGRA
jgi:hypothetical protein